MNANSEPPWLPQLLKATTPKEWSKVIGALVRAARHRHTTSELIARSRAIAQLERLEKLLEAQPADQAALLRFAIGEDAATSRR